MIKSSSRRNSTRERQTKETEKRSGVVKKQRCLDWIERKTERVVRVVHTWTHSGACLRESVCVCVVAGCCGPHTYASFSFISVHFAAVCLQSSTWNQEKHAHNFGWLLSKPLSHSVCPPFICFRTHCCCNGKFYLSKFSSCTRVIAQFK